MPLLHVNRSLCACCLWFSRFGESKFSFFVFAFAMAAEKLQNILSRLDYIDALVDSFEKDGNRQVAKE
jgi:hypothetical protein